MHQDLLSVVHHETVLDAFNRVIAAVEAPGSMLVQQLIVELLSHGWDLAKATGQRTDLAPDMAEDTLAVVRSWYRDQPRGPGNAFGPEQPAPAGAGAADRLAAYLGRTVD